MQIQGVPFQVVDWSQVPVTEHAGDAGRALWRTIEVGNLRVRQVEYSPGYVANHWCERGHVILILEGEMTTELRDGRRFTLGAGSSYHVADGASSHRSETRTGAKLFIVD